MIFVIFACYFAVEIKLQTKPAAHGFSNAARFRRGICSCGIKMILKLF
ncbi:hypothetical protein NEILACOT_04231 [Neisseria lactamica ATCC 23970]|uniref:Uncharacterized protein n=1 Tax=Neisseria lactamica ATCC 23970 TaxID=546265 RepID=D0W9L9_NEILA|nr:hypothetical protein NEILACOT_04231 [Neisseria lactamica ATCC 23970]